MSTLPLNQSDCTQRSPEWLKLRCGMVGSSRVKQAISRLQRKSKNGEPGDPSGKRIELRLEIVAETLTRRNSEHYVSYWMEKGIEYEPLARTAYELENKCNVEQIGYANHPRISRAGASPDGLVGDEGLVEIKCPKDETHLGYLIAGVVPEEYKDQMMWQMVCTERQWCDFVSFSPNMPEDLQLFVIRFERDDKRIAEMEAEVEVFLSEVDEMLAVIRERAGGESATEAKLRQSIALVKSRKQQKQEKEQADMQEMGEEIVP